MTDLSTDRKAELYGDAADVTHRDRLDRDSARTPTATSLSESTTMTIGIPGYLPETRRRHLEDR